MAAVDTVAKEMEALHVGQNDEMKENLTKEDKATNSNSASLAAQSSPPEDDDDEAQADGPSQDGGPERRGTPFSRQIPHQYLLMSFSLQVNFLRVKSNNIRMIIYGEQLARKRGSSNDCKSQCTTLFVEQQKFIDRSGNI